MIPNLRNLGLGVQAEDFRSRTWTLCVSGLNQTCKLRVLGLGVLRGGSIKTTTTLIFGSLNPKGWKTLMVQVERSGSKCPLPSLAPHINLKVGGYSTLARCFLLPL